MKKTVLLLTVLSVLFLTSCQTTKEITLQKDGTGTYLITTDMSGMIGMAKMSMPADKLEEASARAIDTIVSLDKVADNMEELTEEEKTRIRKGNLGLNIDMKNDKFITKVTYPFANTAEIGEIDKISTKVMTKFLQKEMAEKAGEMPKDMPAEGMPDGSIEDYFDVVTTAGVFERKLNTEKHSTLTGEKKETMQQLSSMGVGNSTLIINLPKPVKKTTGKNITVSEDKKKITIESSAEDFFANAKDLEFKIEY